MRNQSESPPCINEQISIVERNMLSFRKHPSFTWHSRKYAAILVSLRRLRDIEWNAYSCETLTFEQFIDRCENERRQRMHLERYRQKRNAELRWRRWAVYTVL